MTWILGILAVYLLILVAIAWVSLHPFRMPVFVSPGAMGAPQEEVEFKSDGNLIRGWWVQAEDPNAPVMVLLHGYMMNRAELSPVAYQLWRRGVSSLVIDFRAHGRSQGNKSGLGWYERHDVAASVAFARSRAPGAKIGLLGSSMGSAASALAMGDDPSLADILILDSCYSRLSSAVLGWWRFLGGKVLAAILSPTVLVAAPFAGFNPFSIDISKALAKIGDKPVLVLHGACDTLALPSEAERNLAVIPGPKKIVWFAGCSHSEGRWEQPDLYHQELFDFLDLHGFLAKIRG